MRSVSFALFVAVCVAEIQPFVYETLSTTNFCRAESSSGSLGNAAYCNAYGNMDRCTEAACTANSACMGYATNTANTSCYWYPNAADSCNEGEGYSNADRQGSSAEDLQAGGSSGYNCIVKRSVDVPPNHCDLIGADGQACWDAAGCEIDDSGDVLACRAMEANHCVRLERDECLGDESVCFWDFKSGLCNYTTTPSPTAKHDDHCASLRDSLDVCWQTAGCQVNHATHECEVAESNECAGLSLEDCDGNDQCWIDWEVLHCRPLENITWDYFHACDTSNSELSCEARAPICEWTGSACESVNGDDAISDCGYQTKIIASKEDMFNVKLVNVNASPCACEEFCLSSSEYEHWRFNTKKMKCSCIDGHIAESQIVRSNSYFSSAALE